MDFSKIKVVIWDLDDTFWSGTLTEGGVSQIDSNISLVKLMTDCGVVNTICSKNDMDPAIQRLKEMGIRDYFVFPSVDWTAKGPRISQLLKDMGLRATNALFLDDNIVNLNEAAHYETDLMIAEPSIIGELAQYFEKQPKSDLPHKRLRNYKVLEKKQESRNSFSDNESFLYASKTRVEIYHDCLSQIDRIYELVQRTNQLNFTKLRSTKEELVKLLESSDVQSGYVTVRDAFGEYGIVGFYALRDNKCIHFLFSCRTIGQGVEQYVYATIGHPELKTEGIVINQVTKQPAPRWINQLEGNGEIVEREKIDGKIVFKGPCDMMGLTSYLNSKDLVCELTYISESRHNNIEHQGCITNFLQIPQLTASEKDILVNECIFNDKGMFASQIYDRDVRLIFISSLQEFHFGIYKNRKNGLKVAFGEWNHPLTDPEEWSGYIKGTVWTSSNSFTESFLKKFSTEWEFLGRKNYSDYIEELKVFLNKIAPSAHLCIFLGSEVPYEGTMTDAWVDRHLVHMEINKLLKEFAATEPRIHLIDYTDFITSPKDYTDSIDHMQRYVHYKVAERANDVIAQILGKKVKQSGKFKIFLNQARDIITKVHLYFLSLRK